MSDKEIYLRHQHEAGPDLPLFFRPWWLDIVSRDWDVALVEEAGEIIALWPYHREKVAGLTLFRNPPMTPYLGPFLKNPEPAEAGFRAYKREESLLERLWDRMPAWDSFDMECVPGFAPFFFFAQKGFRNHNRLTYTIDLRQGTEAIFDKVQSADRRKIRQASSLYTITEDLEALPRFLDMHKALYARKGKKYAFDQALLERIVRECHQRGQGSLLVAKNETGRIDGGIFTVWDDQKAYLLMSAVDVGQAHLGTSRALIWGSIEQARQNGSVLYDFEGSMDPGVEALYRRMGGERRTYLQFSACHSRLWAIKKFLLG